MADKKKKKKKANPQIVKGTTKKELAHTQIFHEMQNQSTVNSILAARNALDKESTKTKGFSQQFGTGDNSGTVAPTMHRQGGANSEDWYEDAPAGARKKRKWGHKK